MPKLVDKQRFAYACQQCGHSVARWMGQCPGCSEWNTLVEEALPDTRAKHPRAPGPSGGAPRRLADVTGGDAVRRTTGLAELDRVLGGGLVQGSIILLGGDPGIGKSTLALQACGS